MRERPGRPGERPLQAVALGYRRDQDAAPRMLARGGGDVARNIIARADEHGVPIERDPDLLQCLAPLQVGGEIPVIAYRAVAEILAFLYGENRG